MKLWFACLYICLAPPAPASNPAAVVPEEKPGVIVVVGAPGEAQFGKLFESWAGNWERACRTAEVSHAVVGLEPEAPSYDLSRLQALLADEPKETAAELWIVLIGHGTFDGREAKFNLRGPDFSAGDLAGWLKPFQRPVVVINTASASGPFINALSGKNRVVITATRSGNEQNFARFGQFFSEAIGDPDADLDKDGQVSLLEAFLVASHSVADFYKTEGRLATEHALLDDNADGMGTQADWFRGVRAVKRAADGSLPDGLRAHQIHLLSSETEQRLSPALRARRNDLELAVLKLRDEKSKLPTDEYYQKLEPLLIELAQLYESSEAEVAADKTADF
jgi:hypothetical protein